MKIQRLLNWTAVGFLSIAALTIGAGWLAFVPGVKEPPYQRTASWGGKGTGPGQFNEPTGVAVAGNEVFVADARNARIQVFDLDGKFKRQFGNKGKAPGDLGRPMNLTIAQGELYVADYWNDRVEVFSLDGTHQRTIGRPGSGPGELNAPSGVAVAPNGDLYVADFYNQRVQHLNSEGDFVKQWGTTKKVGIWGGELNYPTDVAVSANGTLFVADGYNDRVQVFAPDGRFLRRWGGPFGMNIYGPFNGWFTTVTAITVERGGNVFVSDFYNGRVQKFTASGSFLTAFGTVSTKETGLTHPMGIAVSDDGAVYVADVNTHRVTKWTKP